jgi:hypothetical protein
MTVRREIVPTGQAMGARLEVRAVLSTGESWPLASGLLPLARALAIAAEVLMNNGS